ncbi:MAG: methyl-accepting chemotaxis protein [Lachnospiraceae bacterium]|nr:methyl-accepting chemotaxis protein [Lachnospiraceae bacterium]
MNNKEKSNKQPAFWYSLKTKIVFLVIIAIVATVITMLLLSVPAIRSNVSELTQNYMNDLALLAGDAMEGEIRYMGAEEALAPEGLEKLVGDISISGMGSSYAYVVSADGTMMYHPTADKIGQPVENDAVKQLLQEISAGNRPQTHVIQYLFKGVMKYASFYVGQNLDYIIVITADEDEVLSSLHSMMVKCIVGGILALIIWGTIIFIFAVLIVKPIKKTTDMVSKLAELDFTDKDGVQEELNRRKDETGIMGRAIGVLRDELTRALKDISNQSLQLQDASGEMNNSAKETVQAVDQVELAISEIAQGATSQAQETQSATENVIVMGSMIEETNAEVENLRDNARTMRSAGEKAMGILEELNKINQKTREAIEEIYEQTNTTNVSALKIKEATDMITDIAEETNLLSLNASIEAARAGEQGKGFAVVASQIQKLSEQSNESARQIAEIINLLITDSERTVETMEDVKSVISKQNEYVKNTESAFKDVKDGIDKSIESIRTISGKTRELNESRIKVVDIVQDLTAIAEENAASTQETSASAAEVGSIMGDISDNAKHLNQIADELNSNIGHFIIE